VKVIKDAAYLALAIHSSIFDGDGKLHELRPEWLTTMRNKICVRNLRLAHYVNDHPELDEGSKKEILTQLDKIYFSSKRMHHSLVAYKLARKRK